jgi:hypothetical protein
LGHLELLTRKEGKEHGGKNGLMGIYTLKRISIQDPDIGLIKKILSSSDLN